MRRAKTHFEQIPVALVKKIAEEAFPEVKEIRNDNVILKVPAKKTEPPCQPSTFGLQKWKNHGNPIGKRRRWSY
jgi:hypothetical protein